MKCFVWRVPYSTDRFTDGTSMFEFVRDELLNKKILRQGWGVEDLRNGQNAYVERERSKGNTNYQEAVNRFNILKPMLDIEVGDRIVIPKLSLRDSESIPGKYFTVVVCTKVYDFYFPYIRDWDFSHFIEVDWSKEKDSTYDNNAQPYISEQLKDYGKAINRVRNTNLTNAVKALMPELTRQ
ncbi:MAG: hypothetical protein IJK81_01115 [Selenomonadaceae bacterium]|nr:hypothetical protein [Selenomonadaceae bacterium]